MCVADHGSVALNVMDSFYSVFSRFWDRFIEESNTLHIPDYAQKTAAAIAEVYKLTTNLNGVRDKIKLEIDLLIYSSESPNDLFNKLKERGVKSKTGISLQFDGLKISTKNEACIFYNKVIYLYY